MGACLVQNLVWPSCIISLDIFKVWVRGKCSFSLFLLDDGISNRGIAPMKVDDLLSSQPPLVFCICMDNVVFL